MLYLAPLDESGVEIHFRDLPNRVLAVYVRVHYSHATCDFLEALFQAAERCCKAFKGVDGRPYDVFDKTC